MRSTSQLTSVAESTSVLNCLPATRSLHYHYLKERHGQSKSLCSPCLVCISALEPLLKVSPSSIPSHTTYHSLTPLPLLELTSRLISLAPCSSLDLHLNLSSAPLLWVSPSSVCLTAYHSFTPPLRLRRSLPYNLTLISSTSWLLPISHLIPLTLSAWTTTPTTP